jgi:DNA-binding PadR family transcriptional regulator
MVQTYEQQLLEGWEDVFKKGQLTLWILLALKDGPKHMADIKAFILQATEGLLEADDKSMYRALRRYNDVEMVEYRTEANDKGPDRKVYELTDTGLNVLDQFVRRNILNVFLKPSVRRLLER